MFKIAILVALAGCAFGSSFFFTGGCPDGKAVGDRWNPPKSCMECYCDMSGYGCSGCDTLTPVLGCYETADSSLMYPECCPRLACPSIDG